MNEREIRMDILRSLASKSKDPFRIGVQANGTDPIPMFKLSRRNCLRVLSGQYRTICIAQYFRGRGTKQRPAEDTGVRRHDDQIESVSPGKLGDLRRCITR
jgi:hypothetical protein